MPACPARTRLLAATALVLAALTLTGCHDGQGVRDEGPSSVSSSQSLPHQGRIPPRVVAGAVRS
ncbi:hypothetical protein [Streptomyces sp. NPDC046197]|uniref:hypothetical protein n=1 Tax=Streptomyces sp. NPDC046197 TaxID=3154337 RepID=UPI0033CDF2CF